MTLKNGRFHGIIRAFVLACRLLGKDHAGGKKVTALLNLDKPISKKAWTKYTRSVAQNTKGRFRSQNVLKNIGSITVDPS